MMQKLRGILPVLLLSVVTACSGGPECTTEPQSNWLSEAQMQAKVQALGYKVKTFKVSGSCYEIYGWDKAGGKAEVYFDPVSGNVVLSKAES
jgi:hypothetical protein